MPDVSAWWLTSTPTAVGIDCSRESSICDVLTGWVAGYPPHQKRSALSVRDIQLRMMDVLAGVATHCPASRAIALYRPRYSSTRDVCKEDN